MNTEWRTNIGMQVYSPSQFVMTNNTFVDTMPSKWERRRDNLVYKIKRRKAFINWVLKYVCLIPCCLLVAFLWLCIFSKFQSQINAILTGVIIPMCWIIVYLLLDSLFETNSDYIHLKRKGRLYY